MSFRSQTSAGYLLVMTGNVYPLITAIHAAKNRSALESASEYLEELFRWFDFVQAFRTGASANSSGLLCFRLPSFLHEYWERTSTAPG